MQYLYVPVGVPTFELVSARKLFEESCQALREIDADFVCPEDMLLSIDALVAFLRAHDRPDLIVFQNITFANAAYMTEVLHRTDCPVVLWTLREPVIDGGRLRLNSLTGAYSAANTLMAFDRRFEYVFGAPSEARVRGAIASVTAAARVYRQMHSLKMAAIGHTPQGFGFGRALDSELIKTFGVTLESIEARELIDSAKQFTDEECAEFLKKSFGAMTGLDVTPQKNLLDYARLYKAYSDYVHNGGIGAIASRCWPDFFTAFGTPVCSVLSMLNDDGVASACESDMYGALSMWIGMKFSGKSVFFGDPVSLDEGENTITFWHCGMAACSMARCDTGATVGVHPNRKIGPAMDFGCGPFPRATIFRVGRKPDGTFRFFILGGEALDKPKQFTGTSIVVRTDADSRMSVEESVKAGMEPHFVVIQGDYVRELEMLANMLGLEVVKYE